MQRSGLLIFFPPFSAMLDMWMLCPRVTDLSLNFVKLILGHYR